MINERRGESERSVGEGHNPKSQGVATGDGTSTYPSSLCRRSPTTTNIARSRVEHFLG